jgi:hypothetical protein
MQLHLVTMATWCYEREKRKKSTCTSTLRFLWNLYMFGISNRSSATTSTCVLHSFCARLMMCWRVEVLCNEYTTGAS